MAQTRKNKSTRTRNAKAKAEPTRLELAMAGYKAAAGSGDSKLMMAAGAELTAATAANDAEVRTAYLELVKAAINKVKLPDTPEGVTGLKILFGEDGTLDVAPLLVAGTSRKGNSVARTGTGFRVSGPGLAGEYGSYSTAGKAVKLLQGLHPSVNGNTFWKNQNGVSVKSHMEADPSWSAPTGSVWHAGDFTLTVTR